MVEVSICIATWNGKSILKKCLNSIKETIDDISYEIIVVDNGSIDGTKKMIQEEYPDVNLIINRKNYGFTKAYNQAMKKAIGEYLLLLNNDIILGDQNVEMLVDYMKRNNRVGMVGCKLEFLDGKTQHTSHHFPTVLELFTNSLYLNRFFPKSRIFGRTNMTYWTYDDTREVEWLSAAAILVRKKAIEDVGLFDEKIFAFAEDMDWCYRFWKLDWKVIYIDNTIAIHMHGMSSMNYQGENVAEVVRTNITRVGAGILYFFEKHQLMPGRIVLPFIKIFGLSRFIPFGLKYMISKSERDLGHALGYLDILLCSRQLLLKKGLRQTQTGINNNLMS